MELLDEPENPGAGLALHGKPIVKIPFHDERTLSVDMHMARGVISLPGEEHKATTPDLRHTQMLPYTVTEATTRVGSCLRDAPWLRHSGRAPLRATAPPQLARSDPDRVDLVVTVTHMGEPLERVLRAASRWREGPLEDEAEAAWSASEPLDTRPIRIEPGSRQTVRFDGIDLRARQSRLYAVDRWPWHLEVRVEALRPDLVSCPRSSPSNPRPLPHGWMRTEIVSPGRSQGARPRHSRRYGEGAQRGERPGDAIECRRTPGTGH